MSSFVSDPRTLTKDKLKSELTKNNIPIPSKDQRKEVYVKLYREYLSPRATSGAHGEHLNSFSSDEEDFLGGSPPRRKRKPGSVGQVNNMRVLSPSSDIVDVTKLSDDELFASLKKMGVNVGPIQDTTRVVYQRKLERLLAAEFQEEQAKEVIRAEEDEVEDEENDFSDQEDTQLLDENEVAELETSYVRRRPVPAVEKVSSSRSVKVTNVIRNDGTKEEKVESERISTDVDGVIKTSEKVTTSVDGKTISQCTNSSVTTKKQGRALWVQVCVVAVVVMVIFVIISTMESSASNPVGLVN